MAHRWTRDQVAWLHLRPGLDPSWCELEMSVVNCTVPEFRAVQFQKISPRTGRAQWRSQPKNFGGAKVYDLRRITLFCLEKRFTKHIITIYFKNFEGRLAPLPPPWLSLWPHRVTYKNWKPCQCRVDVFESCCLGE